MTVDVEIEPTGLFGWLIRFLLWTGAADLHLKVTTSTGVIPTVTEAA